MSDEQDDPLFGLLTDIAEGVAALSARVDAMVANAAAHQEQVNEALATIAEIATRIYYVSKPTSALPDEIINTSVMDAIIERWPRDAVITMSSIDRQIMSELDRQPGEIIDKLIERTQNNPDESNASRLRMAAFLILLNQERERRLKAREQGIERGGRGR
jgi:cell pole-organizing protein PopZ